MKKNVLVILLSGVLGVSQAQTVRVPHTFKANTPAKAEQVNANFNELVKLIKAQQQKIQQLEQKLTLVSYDKAKKTLLIKGGNVQIVNGAGKTDSANSYGNLIVGYNEPSSKTICSVGVGVTNGAQLLTQVDCQNAGGKWAANQRSGSHGVVIGARHDYTRHGFFVTGLSNVINGDYASVSGGFRNKASNILSVVSSGAENTASGKYAVVSGGRNNTASGEDSVVSGGLQNRASNLYAVISGGRNNAASGGASVVSGGKNNTASGIDSVISGGYSNTAIGKISVVSGGFGNKAKNYNSVVSGGTDNTASGTGSVVSGGYNNTASGIGSVISGGYSNTASGEGAEVSGGFGNEANGKFAVVSGGSINTANTDYQHLP